MKKNKTIEFIKKMNEKFEQKDLRLMYLNVDTLKIKRKLTLLGYYPYLGKYDSLKNEMSIYILNEPTFFHEMLHMASSNKRNIGFCRISRDGKKVIGKGFNEGYTELLNRRLFSDDYEREYKENKGYEDNILVATIIEEMMGQKEMASMYLRAGSLEFCNNLYEKTNLNYDSCLYFLDDLDYLLTKKGYDEPYNYKPYYLISILTNIALNNNLNNQKLTDDEKFNKAIKEIEGIVNIVCSEKVGSFESNCVKLMEELNDLIPVSSEYNHMKKNIGQIYIFLLKEKIKELKIGPYTDESLLELFGYNIVLQSLFSSNMEQNIKLCNSMLNPYLDEKSKKL